jgi:hypothetical protein
MWKMPSEKISLTNQASRRFAPLRYGLGAWTEHIFFAYDLVAQLKPRLLVELGTDRGESYFAFCQSVLENQTGTRCCAIDHWRGDAHAGTYDETTFDSVSAHNRAHYAAFSTLIRSTFDEARNRFEPESIDLLHIDGHHSETAARHDLESWLPQLRAGGILLLHDVTMRGRDFGVWKVWAELEKRGRSWAFAQPPGLGVWEKPPGGPLPPLLETLFASPNESQTALRDYYRQRNSDLQAKMAQQWADGTVRSAPMADETVLQIFWTNDSGYSEEKSADARLGHGDWKEVMVPLATDDSITGLRIDFYSALTTIEIATIEVRRGDGSLVYRATSGEDFGAIALFGDCVGRSLNPFMVEVTGVDPQLHLPVFRETQGEVIVKMRLRVQATA